MKFILSSGIGMKEVLLEKIELNTESTEKKQSFTELIFCMDS